MLQRVVQALRSDRALEANALGVFGDIQHRLLVVRLLRAEELRVPPMGRFSLTRPTLWWEHDRVRRQGVAYTVYGLTHG